MILSATRRNAHALRPGYSHGPVWPQRRASLGMRPKEPRMNRPALPALAFAAALSAAGAATAQDPPAGPPPDGGFGPGRLFISPAGEPFRGSDGLRRWFEAADTDHDGALTLAEFRADFMRFFKVLDADGDGRVDGVENQAYETRIAPEITRLGLADEGDGPRASDRGGPPGGGPGGGGLGRMSRGEGSGGFGGGRRPGGGARLEGAARFSLLNIPQPVRGADADLDWKVSAAEWARAAGQRFALLDADGDGRLTLDTLPALPGRGGHGHDKPGRKPPRD